jgi:hypothetical protein
MPAPLRVPIPISTPIAVRNPNTGLSSITAAAIGNIAQVGRLLTTLLPADTDHGYLVARRLATRPRALAQWRSNRAASSRAGSASARGVASVWRQGVCRKNQPIRSAVPKMKMGPSAMATFKANNDCVGSDGRPSIGHRIARGGQGTVRSPISTGSILVRVEV